MKYVKVFISFISLFTLSLILNVKAEGEHIHAWSAEYYSDYVAHFHNCLEPNCPIKDNSLKDGYELHDYSIHLIDSDHLVLEASCAEGARYADSCSICNRLNDETYIIGEGNNNHNFSNLYAFNSETHWHYCLGRSCTVGTDFEKHNLTNIEVIKEATTSATGLEVHSCICGYGIEVKTDKLINNDPIINPTPDDDPENNNDIVKNKRKIYTIEIVFIVSTGILSVLMIGWLIIKYKNR